jgi:hypothetical protein
VTETGGAPQRPGRKFTVRNEPRRRRADREAKEKEPTQRARLIEVALTSGITYWHDADGNAFATVTRHDRIERYCLRSAAFKRLLRQAYGERVPDMKATAKMGFPVPSGVSDTTMNEMLPTLETFAQNGPTRVPAVRVWRDHKGAVWIDLGNETWQLIAVTADGWRIEDRADVPLIRTNGMRALPMPVRDAEALNKLRALLNLNPVEGASKAEAERADNSFKLIVVFKLSALWPRGPYAILSVNGEHGSAKSTVCRIVRIVTDPNKVPLRSVPRNPDDLFVTAQHSRLLSLDNVSHLSPELADVLCGIATGSGKGARQLYTDGDESILGACNPIIINGIEGLLTRADLADRCLSVMLTAISDEDRRDEAEMEEAIAVAAPGILALLLDAMVMALQNLPGLVLSRMPRMADFTRLACAAAPAFGWTTDEVFKAIIENREIAVEAVIAADAVATAMLAFLRQRQAAADGAGRMYLWIGSATELLGELKRFVPDDTIKSKAWPKQPNHLSGRLKRAAPALRSQGFLIMTGKGTDKNRKIAFRTIGEPVDKGISSSPLSPSSPGNLFNALEEIVLGTINEGASSPSSPDAAPECYRDDQGTIRDAPSSPSSSPENE